MKAIQLSSGAGDALGMLDEDFLNAIAPEAPGSTNPFVIIRDLITSLAADATHLGTSAVVDAFVAGATAVTQPELTASSSPYWPPVQPPVDDIAAPAAVALSLQAYLPADLVIPSAGLADFTPVVAEVVTSVVNDVSYVGNQLVTAAFAAGAMLAAEPGLIVDTLRALISGDVQGALETAVKAVVAPLGPPRIILDAIRTTVDQRLSVLPAVFLPVTESPVTVEAPRHSASVVPTDNTETDTTETDSTETDSVEADAAAPLGPKQRRVSVENPVAVSRPVAGTPGQFPAAVVDDLEIDIIGAATDLGSGISEAATPKPSQRPGRSAAIGGAVNAVQNAARSGLRDVGDAVRKATGRAANAAAGPNAD